MLELFPPNYFSLAEFLIEPDKPTPLDVLEKIFRYHIVPLNPIRHELKMPIHVSKNSGYRSVEYERLKGRSGNSEHTFKDMGAVDLTCADMNALFNLLVKFSPYRRIAIYKEQNFVHCDYKGTAKQIYINTANGWRNYQI
jgi:hypothetical protein